MISHREKHRILKHLAEAAYALVVSECSDQEKRNVYQYIKRAMYRVKGLDEEGDVCNCEEFITDATINTGEAIEAISDGHSILEPKYAYQVCKALGVEFSRHLLEHFYSDWSDYKGVHMDPGMEGEVGVSSLALSKYVAEKLGVADKARKYFGRGSQARAYAEQVRLALHE